MLIICICVSIAIAYANGFQYFDHVRGLYEKGRYEEAIQGFTTCKRVYYEELDVASLDNWIAKCKTNIKKRNAAIQDKRRAKIAEATRKAQEAKLAEEQRIKDSIQQERVKRKLLFVSSNAFLIDCEYPGMHQAIKGHIAKNSDFKFTDDPEKAYWSVYVTANAYEQNITEIKLNDEKTRRIFYSNVVAYVKVVDSISNETIYEVEITDKGNSGKDYRPAAIMAYNNINKTIGSEILKQLNK